MSGLIVHEWVAAHGGSEKVVASLLRAFPDAPLFCLWDETAGAFAPGRTLESSFAKSPLRGHKALALPLMPAMWRRAPTRDYEWVLVSSHLFAHHANARIRDITPTAYYVHTPARYLWAPELDERGRNAGVRTVAPIFRAIDRRAARTHEHVIANSDYVRRRIASSWGIDAAVVHPPVDVGRIQDGPELLTEEEDTLLRSLPERFVLGASRFIPYKRLDLVIAAAESARIPAVIAGDGPLLATLQEQAAQASVPVAIVQRPSDQLLFALYRRASVFVFPAVEDFGIMPVEALAAGTPVVVNAEGGASESVNSEHVGAVFDEPTAGSIAAAIRHAEQLGSEAPAARARDFSDEVFARTMQTTVGDLIA